MIWKEEEVDMYSRLSEIKYSTYSPLFPFSSMKIDWETKYNEQSTITVVGDGIVIVGEMAWEKWETRVNSFKATHLGLLERIETCHSDELKRVRFHQIYNSGALFFKTLRRLYQTMTSYNKGQERPLLVLESDFAPESFLFYIVVNNYYNKSHRCAMNGGLIFHKSTGEWGSHT